MQSFNVNFLGRFFAKIKQIDVSSLDVEFIDKAISILDISKIPQVKRGVMGWKITLDTLDLSEELSFLSKKTAISLKEEIEKKIYETANDRIAAVYSDFLGCAVLGYLRDSKLPSISERVSFIQDLFTPVHEQLSFESQGALKDLGSISPLSDHAVELREDYETLRLAQRKVFFDCVESNPLTDQQRKAVVRENDRNLILAAAGTGKTSVMVAKALDLITSGKTQADEILILSYNKSATVELQQRLDDRARALGVEITEAPKIATFHSLGRKAMVAGGVRPALSKLAEDPLELEQWASGWFLQKMQDSPEFLKDIIDLMSLPVNVFNFSSKEEYDKYISDNEYRTLNGELVRGYQELLIANWLFLNNVEYSYEPQFIKKRRLETGIDYRPDFYIEDAKLYLEHFGVDRRGNTAPWIDKNEYNNVMIMKRDLHKSVGTKLVETYHYNWVEGSLEDRLSALLEQFGVRGRKKSSEEILDHLNEKKILPDIVKRYIKSLKAIRVERLSNQDILDRLNSNEIPLSEKYQGLLIAFHNAYKNELADRSEIDFDDMIIKAVGAIRSLSFEPSWKYILVDEFQDISASRMELIKCLIDHGPDPVLTVVGDDWQSIYRFAGGKLELTTRFDQLVGSHASSKLEKTYRYNSSIAHTAGLFIMENPEQVRKDVVSHCVLTDSQVFLYDSRLLDKSKVSEKATRIMQRILDENIRAEAELFEKTRQIIKKIIAKDPNGSIAIIARYNFLLSGLKDYLSNFKLNKKLIFWTFHASKGLEADNCVLIGLYAGQLGFPNSNKDDAITEALLPLLDEYEHSEERRLFYVGMTRARKRCYMLADPTRSSSFINELIGPKFKVHMASKTFQQEYRQMLKCPVCTNGHYKLFNSKFGKPFYRCSTGPSCNSKPRVCEKCGAPSIDHRNESICNNPNCKYEQKLCPECGRPMVIRDGKYGKFWGCTGYGVKDDQCDYTESYISE